MDGAIEATAVDHEGEAWGAVPSGAPVPADPAIAAPEPSESPGGGEARVVALRRPSREVIPPAGGGERLRIAMIGTRGVPARYGGFETAVEEIGKRLVARGHQVTVYCRRDDGPARSSHLGMQLVTLPALRMRSAETLSHSALASLHVTLPRRHDVVFVFNSANALLLPLLRSRGLPVAVHVDGLEWRRAKWAGAGQRYYRVAEQLAVRWADALIADAPAIARYYDEEFAASTQLLSYGAPVLRELPADQLVALDLTPGGFHLVVARFEPENNVDLLVRGYLSSGAEHPLVVVGGAPYSDGYTAAVRELAGRDPRVRLLGPVWDQDLLNQLYGHARLYLHGHSVGGTNPSLLRAMGAGTPVAAYDVRFNRDVVGDDGWYFADAGGVGRLVEDAESHPASARTYAQRLQRRIIDGYQWGPVADGYEALARRLAAGHTRRGEVTGRRIPGRADPAAVARLGRRRPTLGTDATIGDDANIRDGATIDDGAALGDGATLGEVAAPPAEPVRAH